MSSTRFVLTRVTQGQREVLIFPASPMAEALWDAWSPGLSCPQHAMSADRPRMEKWQKTFAYPTRIEATK